MSKIQDDHQYHVSLGYRSSLLTTRDAHLAHPQADPVAQEWIVGGVDLMIQQVDAELAEYESQHGGDPTELEIADLGALPDTLVKARFAAGLTQAELAELLGVPAQQVADDEAGGYAEAPLARIRRVLDALSVEYRRPLALAVPTRRT